MCAVAATERRIRCIAYATLPFQQAAASPASAVTSEGNNDLPKHRTALASEPAQPPLPVSACSPPT